MNTLTTEVAEREEISDHGIATFYDETPHRPDPESGEVSSWQRWQPAVLAGITWIALIIGVVVQRLTDLPDNWAIAVFLIAYIAGGGYALVYALQDLRHGEVDVNLLMVTAAIGAALVDHWEEGAILLALFSTAGALEGYAMDRTRRAVRSLMELSPEQATVITDENPEGKVVPVEQLQIGNLVLIRPGERIAVDGIVTEGQSAVDQAAITGESVPVDKKPGDQVFTATMNTTGALRVRVERLASESTLSQIIRFVSAAQEQKSNVQRFTDRFEGTYTKLVLGGSALLAVIPPLLLGSDWYVSFYKAMTVLVVASPCALVISTPAATLSALANAARNGLLFKGGGYLEDTGEIEIVAFDKTGTLTEGKPAVTDVIPLASGWSEQEILTRAAAAERLSEHPLAQAIVAEAATRGWQIAEANGFQSVTGMGLIAEVDGSAIVIGNDKLFADLGVDTGEADQLVANLRNQGKTTVMVGDNQTVHGVIALADQLRPSASAIVARLHQLGIKRTVMLSGDHQNVAEAIAAEVGIDEVRADLMPEEKLTIIEELKQEGTVAMVGDGVNDAPALATANVGIAMGGAGSDVALETADLVLMADDLSRLPYAISLGRRTKRIIIENLTFSLGVILVLLTAALTVGIPLPLGVVGHEGSTIIVVLNGLRLLRFRER